VDCRIFLKEIEKSLVDYEASGNAFVKYVSHRPPNLSSIQNHPTPLSQERRLNAYYVKYCQNKPKSDFLVSQESFEQVSIHCLHPRINQFNPLFPVLRRDKAAAGT
jgi:hypothetical protein